MSTAALSKEVLQHTINLVAKNRGNVTAAAKEAGLNRNTFNARYQQARRDEITPTGKTENPEDAASLKAKNHRLTIELREAAKKAVDEDTIKSEILKLRDDVATLDVPAWVERPKKKASSPGVPTLFLSDLHWGEVVKPSQINNVNQYNIAIAHQRMDNVVEGAEQLLGIISPTNDYPGIHLILGGDFISGNIHDELQATNELNTMPTVLDLWSKLVQVIARLQKRYGRVFITCVTGNHGRDTHKIWTKDRHATSFDWLLCCFLAKHFEPNKNITFFIPDGPDAYFKIFNHRYLLSHGDSVRGGDSMIGALGPIIRGDHKKRSRNAQIDMAYDTLLFGHWHQWISLTRLIVNGSLKGYDQYAYGNSFGFEPPQQGLWITHPDHGITFSMPVHAERPARGAAVRKTVWASVPQ